MCYAKSVHKIRDLKTFGTCVRAWVPEIGPVLPATRLGKENADSNRI